jgi:hypothetical protein
MDNDRLEQLWRRLGQEIKEHEAELEELKAKFRVLDEARVLVVAEAAPANVDVRHVFVSGRRGDPSARPTLQEAARRIVCEATAPEGLKTTQVVQALRRLGYGHDHSPKSFYAGVFVALRRLAQRGNVVAVQRDDAKYFKRPGQSGRLFDLPPSAEGRMQ